MPDYSKSIIYKLECKDPNVKDIYVGATTDFYNRKSRHKLTCINNINHQTHLYDFMRLNGGWYNWYMIEIEKVNCRDKRHLNRIEAKYIRELGATLNREIPQDIEQGLGDEEWNRQYRKINRDKFKTYLKEYYQKNSERDIEKRRKNYQNNSENIIIRTKEYYEKNKVEISKKRAVKVKCGCGSQVSKRNLSEHKRSQKHQKWENLPEPNLIFVD
tara:strand:- start:163 stop:807 length:645 start_codon:yes stop_codon:yes gene_type:complete